MTEAEFLATYRPGDYARPSVTVDVAVLTVRDGSLDVLLIRRAGHPYRGCWALPGGFLDVGDGVRDQGEDLDAAAHRELEEETSLPKGSCRLEQLATFGRPGRDPRMRVITVAYFALVRPELAPLVVARTDAREARWFAVSALPELAFDHAEILAVTLARIRERLHHAPIAFDLVPATFTASELRVVHQAVGGAPLHAPNFQRRIGRMVEDGVLVPVSGETRRAGGRPARLYRFCGADRGLADAGTVLTEGQRGTAARGFPWPQTAPRTRSPSSRS